MNLKVNGQAHRIEKVENIAAVLKHFQVEQMTGLAVALNYTVVARQDFEKAVVHDGDEIEIIRAVQGG